MTERRPEDLITSYDMIFATSFGYIDSFPEVAQDHPDVLFEHCTGHKTADNVATYDGRGYEGWYLVGITAGRSFLSQMAWSLTAQSNRDRPEDARCFLRVD